METKIVERKNIIVSLKSNYGEPKKGIDKRIQFLKRMTILDLVMTIFSGGVVLLSIISDTLGFEIFKWQKMGLLTMTILSLSFALRLPQEIYELELLKHLKKINSNSNFKGIDKLNRELKSIINKLNDRIKNNWIVIIFAIGIVVMGLWQLGFDSGNNNSYWKYMKLPVLTFFGLIIVQFISTNRKLTRNIREMEKYCS